METARPPPSPHYLPRYLPDLHPALLRRYVAYCSEPLAPLDLSVRPPPPLTPPCTPPPPAADPDAAKPRIFRHFDVENERKRPHDDADDSPEIKKLKFTRQFFDELRSCLPERAATPERGSPDVRDVEQRPKKAAPRPAAAGTAAAASAAAGKKSKAVRRLQFDEDNTSPVSGTIIRDLGEDETLVVRKGDIDPAFNVVEVTEEAKALIAGIDNRIGRYICRLCRRLYPDAFALAQHRCERIVHIEYRCPECDKVFNCPANLASHRRWHKPRPPAGATGGGKGAARRPAAPAGAAGGEPAPLDPAEANKFSCKVCGKTFRRQAYLRKHYQAHDAAGKGSVDADASPDDDATFAAAKPERSAFRQVAAAGAPYALADRLRDDGYHAFWGKLPRTEFAFDAYYERPPGPEPPRRDCVSSTVSSHSEDSRSLDITGSEDEGSRGRWDGGGGGGSD